MFGLMLTSTHKAAMRDYRASEAHLDLLQRALGFIDRDAMLTVLKQAGEMRDAKEALKLFPAFAAERERFKLAASDLAAKSLALCGAQAELRATESLLIVAENDRDALRPDAQKWRDSLQRARDRKEAKKNATPPARDKRAKNRGGK